MARPIRALIVDDSATTRKLVMSALHQTALADFHFTEAVDGMDALTQFLPGETELIFADLNMPRMSGLEFVRQLHQRHKICPPVVVITAESDRQRLKEILDEPGVAAMMLKPVDRDRLRTGLKTLVDGIPGRDASCVVPHGECVSLALEEILLRTCELTLARTPPYESIRQGDVLLGMTSIIGGVHWAVSVGFTRPAAATIARTFAGVQTAMADEDLGDAIGELVNMIGGRIKFLLASREIAAHFTIPTVISASALRVLRPHPRNNAISFVHYDSPAGQLWTAVTAGATSGLVL